MGIITNNDAVLGPRRKVSTLVVQYVIMPGIKTGIDISAANQCS